MEQHQLVFSFEEYESDLELNAADLELLQKARNATQLAYAPYSRFRVGAAARMANGAIVVGSNQENASFPAGLCAERVLLSICASQYPGIPVLDMAISYFNESGKSERPIAPCGVCRQSLLEYESVVHHPIRIILAGMEGKLIVISKAKDLLPLGFTKEDMQ